MRVFGLLAAILVVMSLPFRVEADAKKAASADCFKSTGDLLIEVQKNHKDARLGDENTLYWPLSNKQYVRQGFRTEVCKDDASLFRPIFEESKTVNGRLRMLQPATRRSTGTKPPGAH